MRLAWFTPASGESGIVEYSRRVLRALRPICEPVLFSDGPAEGFPEDVEAIDFAANPQALEQLNSFDAVFYNLGNNVQYHGAIWEVSNAHPGILVLHDRVLQHFFLGYYADRAQNPDAYRQRMSALYGVQGKLVAAQMLDRHRRPDLDTELLEYSFIEDAVRRAQGVVVHSAWHAEAVRATWGGPICTLWLPIHGSPPAQAPPSSDDSRVTVLTLGHVEFNKHADKVVGVFARDPDLAARARYLIAGVFHPDSPYVRELSEEISSHSLAGTVELLVYLSSTELDAQAAAADVFVNLRWPNYEGCSASLMYQLAFGVPVVVYRSGSFAELPDDAVVKVTPGDDAELHRRLRELVVNERRRRQVGAAGRRFAELRSPAAYARQVVDFAADVAAWGPGFGVANRVGQRLAELGADSRLEGVERVSREIVTLFGSLPR
jgi:glycosyltransferase involved in cell wall biosynthesis